MKLLNGSFSNQTFQVGPGSSDQVTIASIVDSWASGLGSHTLTMDGTITGNVVLSTTANGMTADAGNFTLTNGAGTTSGVIDFAADAEASDIAAAINTVGNSLGVTATASNSATLSALNAAGTISFNLEGTAVSAVISDANNLTALVTAVNGVSGTTGITASFTTVGATDSITLSTTDGRDIAIDTFADADGAVTNTISFNGSTMTEGAATADAVKVGDRSLEYYRCDHVE